MLDFKTGELLVQCNPDFIKIYTCALTRKWKLKRKISKKLIILHLRVISILYGFQIFFYKLTIPLQGEQIHCS